MNIKYFSIDHFESKHVENVRHVKVLPTLSIVQAVEGNYDIQIGNREQKNTGNGGFFIAPSGIQQTIVHHVHPATGFMHARWLFLDAVLNENQKFDFLYDFPVIAAEPYRSELNAVFDTLFSDNNIFSRYACCYQVLKILYGLARPKVNAANESMFLIFDYIQKNYMNKICIETMAKYLHMSESNFYTVFKKYFGISPIAYINKFRISLAAEQLRKTNDTIAAIAVSVGIDDPLYFSKLFHNVYQISPKEYRKQNKML